MTPPVGSVWLYSYDTGSSMDATWLYLVTENRIGGIGGAADPRKFFRCTLIVALGDTFYAVGSTHLFREGGEVLRASVRLV